MRTKLNVAYWILSVLVSALVISYVDHTSFSNAFFVGTMFLPGALAARYMLPKVSFKKKGEGIRNTVYIILAIILLEFLLLILAHNILRIGYAIRPSQFRGRGFNYPRTGVMNIWFISLMVSVLAVGGYFSMRRRPSVVRRWRPARGLPVGKRASPSKRWDSTFPAAPPPCSLPFSCWPHQQRLRAARRLCFAPLPIAKVV